MPKRAIKIHNLARGHVRMSMNKYNLFNLYKKSPLLFAGKTLYQQKYASKQETRGYHGEHIQEKRFKSIFNPALNTFAQLDASLQGKRVKRTPLSLQAFASLEKRLEIAVFRAMFASSVRQARQFILSGEVKVNGVVVKHPSYPLQSGDVFSVDPDKVLYAMGKSKPSLEKALEIDEQQVNDWNEYVKKFKANPVKEFEKAKASPESINSSAILNLLEEQKEDLKSTIIPRQNKVTKEYVLLQILEKAKAATETAEGPISKDAFKSATNTDKSFQVYQKLSNVNHALLSKFSEVECMAFLDNKVEKSDAEKALSREILQLVTEIQKDEWTKIRKQAEGGEISASVEALADSLEEVELFDKEKATEDETEVSVNLPWQKGIYGREDPSKAYFTPWKPRGFLGCFAILPHHIEVSFETCHAVYLRDPIARPGHSEVISPFGENVHEKAYMYYFRKGL